MSSPPFAAYRTNDEWFAVNLADAVGSFHGEPETVGN
jgi:hypothetical protein